MISEPRLPPALAQFTSGGRREPGDEAITSLHLNIVCTCIIIIVVHARPMGIDYLGEASPIHYHMGNRIGFGSFLITLLTNYFVI